MKILTDKFRVIKSDSQRESFREPLIFLVDVVCRLQERYVILWREQIHTSGVVGQQREYRDATRNYLRNHVRGHTTKGVRIHQIDNSIYDFQLFKQIDCIRLGVMFK
jgi:hypothetical protein